MCTRSGTKPGRKVGVEGRKKEGVGDRKSQETRKKIKRENNKKQQKKKKWSRASRRLGVGLREQRSWSAAR
jgi:hypothetical protein